MDGPEGKGFDEASDWPQGWAAFGVEPCGRACLEVCHGLACREVGNEELLAELERLSGTRRDRVSADGNLTLRAGICQGRCAVGPNVRLNGRCFNVEGPSQAGDLLRQALELGREGGGAA